MQSDSYCFRGLPISEAGSRPELLMERPGPGICWRWQNPLNLSGLRNSFQVSLTPGYPGSPYERLNDLHDLPESTHLIREGIVDDPPAVARNGGVIRPGYSKDLDTIKKGVLHSGKGWILELEQKEREKTGIKSLKIGYNRIFGYYIDITKPNLHSGSLSITSVARQLQPGAR